MEANGGIGREGWRTLSGSQWRDWQRGVEDTEWRPVEGLPRGVEDTEWRVWRQRGVRRWILGC
ncbi:unnamed protein product [Staurois parvus]|uniref:Uncharacterized protein n=1 Tax=Staurois parvus TaxID=386267 RepID=A0ABN9FVN4_9NEOB|nr:unnamed protein product [Staurois parvus]